MFANEANQTKGFGIAAAQTFTPRWTTKQQRIANDRSIGFSVESSIGRDCGPATLGLVVEVCRTTVLVFVVISNVTKFEHTLF